MSFIASHKYCASAVAGVLLMVSSFAFTDVLNDEEIVRKKVLYVAAEDYKRDSSDDVLVKEYLESKGLQVTMATANDSAKSAKGKDLVIISSTADHRVLGDRYQQIETPIMTWNAYSYPLLGMTGTRIHQDFSVVRESVMHQENHANFYANFVNQAHPIAKAGQLSAGLFGNYFFSGETDMNWANPGLGADTLAIFKDRRHNAAVFAYEKGVTLVNDLIAPARRIGIFLGDDGFHQLTEAQAHAAQDPKEFAWFAGRRLFDASLRWALSPPPAAPLKNSNKLKKQLLETAKNKKLLYVRRLDMPWPAGEQSVQQHTDYLQSLGFQVTVRDTMESDDVADQYDLVIVSAAINKFKFANKYANANVPVLLEETKNVDGMNMVGRERTVEYGTNDHKDSIYPPEAYVNIIRESHAMSGSASAGLMKLYKEPGVMGWSRPGPGAFIIASIPNQPDHAAVWGYEKGATMAHDHLAPARRVVFPIDFNMFTQLTDEGLDLYNAVLLWCVSNK